MAEGITDAVTQLTDLVTSVETLDKALEGESGIAKLAGQAEHLTTTIVAKLGVPSSVVAAAQNAARGIIGDKDVPLKELLNGKLDAILNFAQASTEDNPLRVLGGMFK